MMYTESTRYTSSSNSVALGDVASAISVKESYRRIVVSDRATTEELNNFLTFGYPSLVARTLASAL